MDQQETPSSIEVASATETVWETLTATQQETVLRTMVWICCQLAEQWMLEVSHELVIE
jgi:hypothetical protein